MKQIPSWRSPVVSPCSDFGCVQHMSQSQHEMDLFEEPRFPPYTVANARAMPFPAHAEIISLSSLAALSSTFWLVQQELRLPLGGSAGVAAQPHTPADLFHQQGRRLQSCGPCPSIILHGYLWWLHKCCPWVGRESPLCCCCFRPQASACSCCTHNRC